MTVSVSVFCVCVLLCALCCLRVCVLLVCWCALGRACLCSSACVLCVRLCGPVWACVGLCCVCAGLCLSPFPFSFCSSSSWILGDYFRFSRAATSVRFRDGRGGEERRLGLRCSGQRPETERQTSEMLSAVSRLTSTSHHQLACRSLRLDALYSANNRLAEAMVSHLQALSEEYERVCKAKSILYQPCTSC